MSLTEEELNFLRFYYINLKVASKAVRVYFDTIYPPVGLAKELINNEAHLKSLRFITRPQINILYPNSGNLVKSEQFDTTLMICLLRNMNPCRVPLAPAKDWDKLPNSADTSFCADLARFKCYRNFVSHHEKGELTVADFNRHWGDLEQAIRRLGGPIMHAEAQSAPHVILDTSLKDMLLELRNSEKSLHEMTDKINSHQSSLDSLSTNEEELVEKIHKMEAETQKLTTKLSDYEGTIDACTKEIETCKNNIKKNKEVMKELQNQSDKKQNEIENLITRMGKLEIEYEQHDKILKEHGEHLALHDGQLIQDKEHLALHDGQLIQDKEHLAMHDGRLEKCEKKIHDIKEKQYDTDVTSVRSKQKRLEDDIQALMKEDVRERTFVTTKSVADGLALLKQNGVLLITGHAGTGKSRIGRHVLHMFCTDDTSYKCIKLNTLEEWGDMVNREENVVVLIDDIFGETNCIYNGEKDTPILDKVHAYVCKGNIKVIITIRDTVKRQCKEVFDSHRLFKFDFVDLSSEKYVLNRQEKEDMLKNYMKTVRKADFAFGKGFLNCKGNTIVNYDEVLGITVENPVKGFPLVVYQFVHNDKYFRLGSKFFDRPTEAMLEEINAIRVKGEDHRMYMIQYALIVYIAINENFINLDDSSCVLEMPEIIKAIYKKTIRLKSGQIADAICQLRGSYLVKIPNRRSYRFHHQTIQETVILTFALFDAENVNQIITLVSWSFILKIFKSESYNENEGEVVLRIPTNSFNVLAKRLVDLYLPESWTCIDDLSKFLRSLSNTDVFKQEYRFLLPRLLEAFEMLDNSVMIRENIIRCGGIENENIHLLNMKNKECFLSYILVISAESKNQFDVYNFILKNLNQMLKNSNHYVTIAIIKSAIIKSVYRICSTKDVQNVKATFDVLGEHKIPVLFDQGVDFFGIEYLDQNYFMSDDGNVNGDDPTSVFLTLCVWKAYTTFNEPVLDYLLSKYNETPFDFNIFLGKICETDWFEWQGVSDTPVKWIIERCKHAELFDTEIISELACRKQIFDTVKYLASKCKIDVFFCLKTFLNECSETPYNQELFNFLLTKIDRSSKDLIPIFLLVLKNNRLVPDYMYDVFLPLCHNNIPILTVACETGNLYVVKRIMENSNNQFVTANFQLALSSACCKNSFVSNVEEGKLNIIEYIAEKCGFEQLDWKAACQQACDSTQFIIVEWIINNIDLTVLDEYVYTIIKSALLNNKSSVIDHILKNIEKASLDTQKLLKSVTEHLTDSCSSTMLELVSFIWYTTEDKEKLHMEEIVSSAYETKCFELLIWIHKNCHPYISIDGSRLMMCAFENCRFDVAKSIHQIFEQTSIDKKKLIVLIFDQILKSKIHENNLDSVKWILKKTNINPFDLKSIVLDLLWKDHPSICYHRDIEEIKFNLFISIFDKYLSTEEICLIIKRSVDQGSFVSVNWFLKNESSYSFDKQIILNKACAHGQIETVQILSKYLHSLDITQAIIHALTLDYCDMKISYHNDKRVAILDLLWEENIKLNVSFDIRTTVSAVCKMRYVHDNIMTWILLNMPHDQIEINEVLITCCRDSQFNHVQYIFTKVDNARLDIQDAFFKACRMASPSDKETNYLTIGNKYSVIMLADFLFQKLDNKQTSLSLVVNNLLERKNYDLVLHFLQTGLSLVVNNLLERKNYDLVLHFLQTEYFRNINMKNLLNQACKHRHFKLVQWILANVQHNELDIKSAFLEASVTCVNFINSFAVDNDSQLELIICLALMWHYIQDINFFEIDAALQTITEFLEKNSLDLVPDIQTWLQYIKKINQKRIDKCDSTLLKTEINKMQDARQRQQLKYSPSSIDYSKHRDESSCRDECQ